MIPAKTLVFSFDLQYDRLSSDQKSNLRLEHKLFYINRGLDIYVEKLIAIAELNTEIREALRILQVKEHEVKIVKRGETFDIAEVPKNCIKILRQSVLASKEECGKKELPLITVSTDDLSLSKTNPFWKSDFAWETLLSGSGSEGTYVYHLGEMRIEKVYMDYYRKPNTIHAPSLLPEKSYIDWTGKKQVKDSDLELDFLNSARTIVDIAVLLAKADSGDVQDYQLELSKIINVNKLGS